MSRNILEAIVAAKFVATDAQVEQLAGIVATGQQANGTYLGVLVAHCQAELPKRKRATKRVQSAVIDAVHERLYVHVMKGVGDEALEMPERNRRATFARTAASTLRYFVTKGGSIRELDPADITKAKLRGEVAPSVPAGTRAERAVQKSGDSFMRAVERLAKKLPDSARVRVEAMQEQLEALLDRIGKEAHKAERPKAHAKRQPSARIVSARLQRERPRAEARAH
jgi:hypothetical protein